MDEKRSENHKEEAREMLTKATVSEPWKNPNNKTRYALMIDGEVIGYLRKNIELSKLSIGKEYKTWRGKKVELLDDNKHAGFLWV